MDCKSDDMIGMPGGMKCEVEERMVVGGSASGIPGSFPPPGVLIISFREALTFGLVIPQPGLKAPSRSSRAPKSLAEPGRIRGLVELGAWLAILRSHEPSRARPQKP